MRLWVSLCCPLQQLTIRVTAKQQAAIPAISRNTSVNCIFQTFLLLCFDNHLLEYLRTLIMVTCSQSNRRRKSYNRPNCLFSRTKDIPYIIILDILDIFHKLNAFLYSVINLTASIYYMHTSTCIRVSKIHSVSSTLNFQIAWNIGIFFTVQTLKPTYPFYYDIFWFKVKRLGSFKFFI